MNASVADLHAIAPMQTCHSSASCTCTPQTVVSQGFGDFYLEDIAPAGLYPIIILMIYVMTMNM